jgi:hypothetical protein
LYNEQITASYGVFVSNSVSNPQNTSLVLSERESTISDDIVNLDFTDFDTSSLITVTYSPRTTPSHSYPGLEVPIETFVVSAEREIQVKKTEMNSANEIQYQISASVDLDKLNSWRIPTDLTSTDGQVANLLPFVPRYVLKRWDETVQSWVSVTSELDLTTGVLRATTDQFGEFALFIELRYEMYLPLVLR